MLCLSSSFANVSAFAMIPAHDPRSQRSSWWPGFDKNTFGKKRKTWTKNQLKCTSCRLNLKEISLGNPTKQRDERPQMNISVCVQFGFSVFRRKQQQKSQSSRRVAPPDFNGRDEQEVKIGMHTHVVFVGADVSCFPIFEGDVAIKCSWSSFVLLDSHFVRVSGWINYKIVAIASIGPTGNSTYPFLHEKQLINRIGANKRLIDL